MAGNSNLLKANKAKKDEFYTQLADIEAELKHYRKHFKGKVVFCNCDDPYESNFFKYFAMNFNFLGLKKLVATCYKASPIIYTQLNEFGDRETISIIQNERRPYKIEIAEVVDANGDGAIDLTDVEYLLKNRNNALTLLDGDGDFRSTECVEILKHADIVVTNPPFSLFREYVSQLIEYDKKFIIIGNINAITYKEIFPLIKNNKMWAGYTFNKTVEFIMHSTYEIIGKGYVDEKGKKHGFVPGVCWFTNLDIIKRKETLELYRKYSPQEYLKYDNYDAIDVNKVSEIPDEYYGIMGVPITFIQVFNPEQFEILDITDRNSQYKTKNYTKNDSDKYSDLNRRGVLVIDGKYKSTFAKLLIRRKQNGN